MISISVVNIFSTFPNRAKFLELATDSVAADSLYLVPEDGGGSRLEMGQYKDKQSHLSLLGKMWYMSDQVKQFQVGLASTCTMCLSNIALLVCPTRNEQFVNF